MPTAILLGALAIAATLAFVFRWEVTIRVDRGAESVFRLDRWSGTIVPCKRKVIGEGIVYDCERQLAP
jgi:hypothetical protein